MADPGEPLSTFIERTSEERLSRSEAFRGEMIRRRSVRSFSSRTVPREIIENCIAAAAASPSGANRQPWHFVAVADPAVKSRIREGAEAAERELYERRASKRFLDALEPLHTGPEKPFLVEAPWLIAVFMQRYRDLPDGTRLQHHYPIESASIAMGILITAIHHAGLVTVPYTPSPAAFLARILKRPAGERALAVFPVGCPAEDATVPALQRRAFDEIATFIE